MDAAEGPLSASWMMESLMACGRRLTIRQDKEHNAAWAAICVSKKSSLDPALAITGRPVARLPQLAAMPCKISDGIFREGVAVRYAFIERYRTVWPIARQCQVLKVSASGYRSVISPRAESSTVTIPASVKSEKVPSTSMWSSLQMLSRATAGPLSRLARPSLIALPLQAPYCGAKFAIRGFTDSLRSELLHARINIHLTMVQMPALNTPQFDWGRNKLPKRPQPVPPGAGPVGTPRRCSIGLRRRGSLQKAGGAFGALLGRNANRIAGGSFTLDGRTYHLPTNDGTSTLHGGPVGFDKVFWKVASAAAESAPALVLTHVSPDGDQGFPGDLSVQATYRLDGNSLWQEFEAHTTKSTLVSLSAHPYFNLAGAEIGDALDHVVTIPSDTFLPTDDKQIPTGEIRSVAGTPFDFREPTPLGARIRKADPQLIYATGYDQCFVLGTDQAPAPRRASPPARSIRRAVG